MAKQELGVGDARQAPAQRGTVQPWQHVARRAEETLQVGLRGRRQRCAWQPVGMLLAGAAKHQLLLAPDPAVEVDSTVHKAVALGPATVEELGLETPEVDAHVLQQAVHRGREEARRVERLRTAVTHDTLARA